MPPPAERRSLVIKVTCGSDSPERCAQAFTVAATAAGAGIPVSLWLTGEAAWFALPDKAGEFELDHSAPLDQLLAVVLDSGQVTLCSQCAQRREISADELVSGIRIAGSAAFVEEIMAPGAQALVY